MKQSNTRSSSGIKLNLHKFLELQGDMNESEMAKKLNLTRSQLWRIKKGKSGVGEGFIVRFMTAYPNIAFEDYFFVKSVE